jgi:hypothetical protein
MKLKLPFTLIGVAVLAACSSVDSTTGSGSSAASGRDTANDEYVTGSRLPTPHRGAAKTPTAPSGQAEDGKPQG